MIRTIVILFADCVILNAVKDLLMFGQILRRATCHHKLCFCVISTVGEIRLYSESKGNIQRFRSINNRCSTFKCCIDRKDKMLFKAK
jgi:hypothetical protein